MKFQNSNEVEKHRVSQHAVEPAIEGLMIVVYGIVKCHTEDFDLLVRWGARGKFELLQFERARARQLVTHIAGGTSTVAVEQRNKCREGTRTDLIELA